MAKDAYLLRTGAVRKVVWHFFVSEHTGKGGPNESLLNLLKEAGIEIMFH